MSSSCHFSRLGYRQHVAMELTDKSFAGIVDSVFVVVTDKNFAQ